MKKTTLSLVTLLTAGASFAQLSIDADLNTRFEYRHGQGTVFSEGQDAATFISQRTRIGADYKTNRLQLHISLQNVGTWGDAGQPGFSEKVGLFEGYAKLGINDELSLQLGRQQISYDDERILGALNWAQSGRTHDAALLTYEKDGFKANAALSYSQDSEKKSSTYYEKDKAYSYKTMQFLHLNKKWNNNSASFLFMNNGFQIPNDKGVYNRQTFGVYLNSMLSPEFGLEGNAYMQTGKAAYNVSLSAYDVRLKFKYNHPAFKLAVGGEILSGTNFDEDKESNTFIPLYGTNHGFNGFMDYFYVGNHMSIHSPGLNDFFAEISANVGGDAKLSFQPHLFYSNATLDPNINAQDNNYLGTELDLIYSNQIYKDVKLNVGYSHMFQSETLANLRSGSKDSTNNWFFAQLSFTPNLFRSNW